MRRAAPLPALLLGAGPAAGCTYFEVRAPGVSHVAANTLEWFDPAPVPPGKGWSSAVHPRGEQFAPSPFCANDTAASDGWQGKFGYVAMDHAGREGYRSGNLLNEAGLAVGAHALRGVGTYRPSSGAAARVCASDVASWAASSFASVAELRAALPSTAVFFSAGGGSNSAPGLMWAVTDAVGDSVVVDYFGGELHVHNNTVGVLANDPDFPWQLRNLNNYVGLSAAWPSAGVTAVPTEVGLVPAAVGHGQNLLGIPGDLSPPARFVRSFFMREYALQAAPPRTVEDSLVLATGVLNSMHITKGYNARFTGEGGYDYTQFCTLKVPAERLMYFRTYEDMQWRLVNLSAIDFTLPASSLPAGSRFAARDITADLQAQA